MNPTATPDFSLYEPFTPGFARARQGVQTPFAYLDIDLNSLAGAGDGVYFNIAGDFLYVDAISSGFATIDLNVQQSAPQCPFYVQAGFAVQTIFTGIKVRWVQQAGGKLLRLAYATGQRVIPASGVPASIAVTAPSALAPLATSETGPTFTSSFSSAALLTAGSSELITSLASNVSGIALSAAAWTSLLTTGPNITAIIAHTSAPASLTTGKLVCLSTAHSVAGAQYLALLNLPYPIRIPAGLALYFFSYGAETFSARGALFSYL